MSAPPAPFVPAVFQGQSCFALLVAGLGDPAEHAKQVETIRNAARPDFGLVTPIPYTALQKMFDAPAAWGTFGCEKLLSAKVFVASVARPTLFVSHLQSDAGARLCPGAQPRLRGPGRRTR